MLSTHVPVIPRVVLPRPVRRSFDAHPNHKRKRKKSFQVEACSNHKLQSLSMHKNLHKPKPRKNNPKQGNKPGKCKDRNNPWKCKENDIKLSNVAHWGWNTDIGNAQRCIHPISSSVDILGTFVASSDCILPIYSNGHLVHLNYFVELGIFRPPVGLLSDIKHLLCQTTLRGCWPRNNAPKPRSSSVHQAHIFYPSLDDLQSNTGTTVYELYPLSVLYPDKDKITKNPLAALSRVSGPIPELDISLTVDELQASMVTVTAFSGTTSNNVEDTDNNPCTDEKCLCKSSIDRMISVVGGELAFSKLKPAVAMKLLYYAAGLPIMRETPLGQALQPYHIMRQKECTSGNLRVFLPTGDVVCSGIRELELLVSPSTDLDIRSMVALPDSAITVAPSIMLVIYSAHPGPMSPPLSETFFQARVLLLFRLVLWLLEIQ
jgi:hypothetical protein